MYEPMEKYGYVPKADYEALRAENERLKSLLRRYRCETPLGHQPHMIAAEVDAALGGRLY